MKETLIGAKKPKPEGFDKLDTHVNFFIGNDKNKWKKETPLYGGVNLGTVYTGVEYKLEARDNNVEKIFVVYSDGNVDDIKIKIDGANNISFGETGDLVIETEIAC